MIRSTRWVFLAVLAAGAMQLGGCAASSPDFRNQQTFRTPEEAATALVSAAKAGDSAALEAIFGEGAREVLSSGDPVADRHGREVFAIAARDRWSLERINGSTRELVVGHDAWPFPVPVVKDRHGWWFNTTAGKREVLARRIGRNELATMGALRTYVDAQREYAGTGRDGKPAGIYAQRIRSEPGTHNGLYWPAQGPGEPRSPLGEFAAAAAAEGYGTQSREGSAPYHGYFFRSLVRQGASAPGGKMEYVVNGEMTGGFAMIAFPAEYGNSGIMSFLVGADGVLYEADLGTDTATLAREINAYDPDARWRKVD